MIKIITEGGHVMDLEDSRRYIEFKLNEVFKDISEFMSNKEIFSSQYWGDCIITQPEECYKEWIIYLAKLCLNHKNVNEWSTM